MGGKVHADDPDIKEFETKADTTNQIEPNLSLPTAEAPPARPQNTKRVITMLLLLAIPFALLALGAIIFWKPVLRVKVLPQNAVVRVDGVVRDSTIRLAPGKHIVSVSAPGFVKYEELLNLHPISFPKISLNLRPLPTPQYIVNKNAYGLASDQNRQQFFWIGKDRSSIFRAVVEKNTIKDKQIITPNNLPAIDKVIFSPDFQVAVLKLVNGQTGFYDFKRYDMLHQEFTTWGENIGDATWSPDGKMVIYQKKSPETGDNALFRAKRSNANPTRFFDLRQYKIENPQLSWSSDGYLLSLVDQGKLYILDIQNNILTQAIAGGVESARFAPDSNHILFTQNSVLKWLEYKRSSGLDNNIKNSQIGRIRLLKIYNLNLQGEASQAYFDQKRQRVVLLTKKNQIYLYDFINQSLKEFQVNFYARAPEITSIGLSSNGSLLYLLTKTGDLLSVKADSGEY